MLATVIGPDRPGIVEALASRVATGSKALLCAASADSSAASCAPEIPSAKIDDLTQALRGLEADGLRIHLHIEKADRPAVAGTLASLVNSLLASAGSNSPSAALISGTSERNSRCSQQRSLSCSTPPNCLRAA